jgi:hypothetical protein
VGQFHGVVARIASSLVSLAGVRRHTHVMMYLLRPFRYAGHYSDFDAEIPMTGVDWPHTLVGVRPTHFVTMYHHR